MLDNESNMPNSKAKVTIKKFSDTSNSLVKIVSSLLEKISSYIEGARNTYAIYTQHNGSINPNAFHDFLDSLYALENKNSIKVLSIPILFPSVSNQQIYKKVISIGNPVILRALRAIPRAEIMNNDYYVRNPHLPRISGGRAFESVLKAIGMNPLIAEYSVHRAFTQQMISTLTIKKMDSENPLYKNNSFKSNFINVITTEINLLIEKITDIADKNEEITIDFRLYALKIFLKGFYPRATWNDDWINKLSDVLEDVSNRAFLCIMNPYNDIEALRLYTKEILDPMIDEIMVHDQSYYLSQEYVDKSTPDIIRGVINSLLFAAGDNIKKYLDHIFIEMGSDTLRNFYRGKNIGSDDLELIIKEIGRLYTTIYAQPGTALDNFIIEYKKGDINEKFIIKAGDELHYTTWQANIDTAEWGEYAAEFNPELHKSNYHALNPLSTFGSGFRRCLGKDITLTIIKHTVSEFNKHFIWDAKLNGVKNHHQTRFNFNNSVDGNITYLFSKRNRLRNQPDVMHSLKTDDVNDNYKSYSV